MNYLVFKKKFMTLCHFDICCFIISLWKLDLRGTLTTTQSSKSLRSYIILNLIRNGGIVIEKFKLILLVFNKNEL